VLSRTCHRPPPVVTPVVADQPSSLRSSPERGRRGLERVEHPGGR
jgi:hypothetical protein